MPTSRAYSFLVAALLLYIFANQTQVGWLYVMSAVVAGAVAAAWWLNRGALAGVVSRRQVGQGDSAPHEGDMVPIELTFHNARRGPAAHLRITEVCPLAPPSPEGRPFQQSIFVPLLPGRADVHLRYEVTADRRGLHEFPPQQQSSRAPFGFFERRRTRPLPTPTLVYPEVRPLHRLALLDRQPLAQVARPRAGVGTEIIGVRPYRSGDSPRHIHWRTVARTGQLASKEFADETQPGLTLALDSFAHPYAPWPGKHTPFEWAVKVAASIGDYALRRGYPLRLAGPQAGDESELLPVPHGPLSLFALLEYLARVQPVGALPIADALNGAVEMFVAAVLPWPDPAVLEALLALRRRGLEVLAVALDPATFPAGGPSAKPLADELQANGIDTRLVSSGDDWAELLWGE